MFSSASHKCSRFKVLQSVKQQCGANDILCLGDHITEKQHGFDNHYYSVIDLVVTIYINLKAETHCQTPHLSNEANIC